MERLGKYCASFIIACLLGSLPLFAETKEMRKELKHEVRVGVGDQMFESIIWRNPSYIVNTMPAEKSYDYKENYRYLQHFFVEYQYRLSKMVGFGFMFDTSSVMWDKVTRNGQGRFTSAMKNQFFTNVTMMATFRLTYASWKYANLFGGGGIGINLNTGTEVDGKGRHTGVGLASGFTALGASFNYNQWFATLELGGTYALSSMDAVYMLNSRLISFSVGMRF